MVGSQSAGQNGVTSYAIGNPYPYYGEFGIKAVECDTKSLVVGFGSATLAVLVVGGIASLFNQLSNQQTATNTMLQNQNFISR